MATSVALPASTAPKPNWNDLREAFVTVKKEYLMKQTQENVTLKEVNQSIKMQNSHLSGQIDKLKRLCHLCLNLIMTSQQQQQQNQQKNQPLSSSSTSSGLKTVKSDNTLNVTANEQSPSPDSPVEDEIELLILEYLYGGSGSADGNSSADNTTQLVKRFEELASRLAAVTEGVKSTVSDSAKLKNLTVQKQQQQQQYLQSPCEQKKHKRSLIKRLLSGFHHQNELESSRNGVQKTSSKAQSSTTPTSPTPSISSPMCTHLANSAATAAGHHHHHHQSKHQNSHLRPSNSIQKLHEFFELQQENQRILPKACSAQEAAEEAENEEANQLTVTNNYHLQVAHIKAMNGGVGSPTKSVSATEEHSGAQLSTHIDVNGIVDTAPKMSEVAMFCGLKENNVANPLLNVAKQKEAEKRHQQEEEKAKASKAKKNGQEEEDEKEEQRKKDSVSVMDSSFFVSLYTLQQQQQQQQKPIFEIGLLDDDVQEEEESGRKEEEVVSDDSDDGQPSPPDSVVDSSYDADSLLEEMDMEQEMDRLLEHIHQHQWFVLPAEATAPAASDVVNQLNAEVIDLNNVEAAFQAIHRLWLARKHSTTRLLFFYQMFSYLFDKYLNVIHCDCHHPPCAPSVEATLFGKLGVQIVRRLLECINRSRHLVIQIELLSSIESLVYNRTHYRPALSEIFHHLFTAGLIEATAFVEWAKLDDPSAQFEAAQNKQNSGSGNGQPLTSAEQKQQKTPSKETKSKLKASLSMPPKLSTMTMTTASAAAASSSSSSAQQTETQLTNRERLFQELKKAGFAIFKCKF